VTDEHIRWPLARAPERRVEIRNLLMQCLWFWTDVTPSRPGAIVAADSPLARESWLHEAPIHSEVAKAGAE